MSTAPELEPNDPPLENAKPPFLRRVRIRGYKSIAFCDVTLEPLTILVGRNASGKSNFLDALGFLRDMMEMRAAEAVNERKGWRAIQCRNGSTPRIEIGVEATFEGFRSNWDAEYSFSLEISPQNIVFVREEELTLTQQEQDRRCGYRVIGGSVEWIGREHFRTGEDDKSDRLDDPRLLYRHPQGRLLLSAIGTHPFSYLAEGFAASAVYNFSPPNMRHHQPISASPELEPDGRNLARAIEALREVEPDTVERLGRYLSSVVDGVKEFQTVTYGDFETVQFGVESRPGAPLQRFDASSMSDGTLRILAALVAAHQIHLPLGSGFVGIEEPETSLHPAAMRALVDALDEATLRKQIILTTHSAEMLDNPTIRPENVRVVEMIDGQTVIAPVDDASVEIVRRKLNTLGGLERDNLLEADLDDLERQRQLAQSQQEPSK
jgi:predicted ATPase